MIRSLGQLAEPKTVADTYEIARVLKGLEPFIIEHEGHKIWNGAYSGRYGVFEHRLVHQLLMALEKHIWGVRLYHPSTCPSGCVSPDHWYTKDVRPQSLQEMWPKQVRHDAMRRTYRS